MNVFADASFAIGRTPLIRLSRIEQELDLSARLFAKTEFFNPGGSVKDRAALYMLDGAERRNVITRGSRIAEPTSGNTGIGLAWLCAVRGYRLTLFMPDTASAERAAIAAVYGAETVLTPGADGMDGAVERAKAFAAKTGAFMPYQFNNCDNPLAHELTTGEEIFRDADGRIDFFVATIGSGGTITGVGKALKRKIPDVRIIGVEPASSPLISRGYSGRHAIQGIGAGFIPEVLDLSIIDRMLTVSDSDAVDYACLLAKKEGLFCGISSGAALKAACLIAQECAAEKNIVVLLPDGGERYLSTGLFS